MENDMVGTSQTKPVEPIEMPAEKALREAKKMPCYFCGLPAEDGQVCDHCVILVRRLRQHEGLAVRFAREAGLDVITQLRSYGKVNRNAKCPCGSGKKFKHCCWLAEDTLSAPIETVNAEAPAIQDEVEPVESEEMTAEVADAGV